MHIFLSYPKSGRTWIRFMVNTYLARLHTLPVNQVFEVEKLFEGTPKAIFWTHFNGAMLFKRPYFEMGFDFRPFVGKPCVMLVRNLYGTMASAYYHARYRKAIFDGSPSEFVRSPQYGILKLVSHYNQVAMLSSHFSKLDAFRYEEIRAQPATQLARIVEALNVEVNEDLINEVIEEGRLPRMQELAARPEYAGTVLAELDPDAPCNRHIKTGNNKKFRELFTTDDLSLMARVIDDTLIKPVPSYLERCVVMPEEPAKMAA